MGTGMLRLRRPRWQTPHLHVEQVPSAFLGATGSSRWSNKDIDPVRREDRRWGVVALMSYWASEAFSPVAMEMASSILALGLSCRDALVIVPVAFLIISFVISLNGATGVLYHAPFPVLSRASWGFWGSYLPIVSRVILAMFWFAIQSMNGAYMVQVMVTAIWPSFKRLPNHIPASQGITTAQMLCYLLFWLLQLPALYTHPTKLRYLFITKSIVVPITMLAMLAWAYRSTSGTGGPLLQASAASKLRGSDYSYAWLSGLTSVISGISTLSVNMPDFSRYSRASAKWQIVYVPLIPAMFALIAFVGVACTSAGQAHYGQYLWNPADLMLQWDNRACQFFAAAAMVLAIIGTNISANSLSAANDLAALFPRFMNLRRGQLTCAVLAWIMVPWKILASAKKFLNFLSAYGVFMGPIAAILCWDHWWLHCAKYDVVALYHPEGIYHYKYGINWRAIVAFLIGVAPDLPGFINNVNPAIDVGVGTRPFTFSWLLGFAITTVVYMTLSWIWKPHGTFIERAVKPDEVYDAEVTHSLSGSDSEGKVVTANVEEKV